MYNILKSFEYAKNYIEIQFICHKLYIVLITLLFLYSQNLPFVNMILCI